MKLGLFIGYSGATVNVPMDLILECEALGFDSVWTAEAYGSDAITPLAYIAAKTSRIKLATGIMQVPGRTPAMTAMTAMTLDAISGGRFICGLGNSGPQVVEGWHGQPYDHPSQRLREYVEILRKIWAREEPAALDGEVYQLPYRGPRSTGLGKPLKSILHGRNMPIYLATLGPNNIRLTAEIADGWLPAFFAPAHMDVFRPSLEEGFARAGGGKSYKDFDIAAQCTVVLTDDVKAALARTKPGIALYMGGMGARGKNFYNDLCVKYGYADAAAKIQELYLAGRKDEAEAAVPDELADEMALVGPRERIEERLKVWADANVGTLLLSPAQPAGLRLMAELTGATAGATA